MALELVCDQGGRIFLVHGLPMAADCLCLVVMENRNKKAGESCVISWGWRMQKKLTCELSLSSPFLFLGQSL